MDVCWLSHGKSTAKRGRHGRSHDIFTFRALLVLTDFGVCLLIESLIPDMSPMVWQSLRLIFFQLLPLSIDPGERPVFDIGDSNST